MSAATSASTATLRISTPEGVTFALPLAGPASRAAAAFVDYCICAAIMKVVQVAALFTFFISSDLAGAFFVLTHFVLTMGYCAFCELFFQGRTVGKRVMGLRVMDERGLSLRPSQVLIRNLVRIADQLPYNYAVGGICCLFTQRCQRLGDLAAGTVVVRVVKSTAPNIDELLGDKYNSFRAHPHMEARLRQKISADEAQLALAALVRCDEMDPAARVKIFGSMAERFKSMVKFPEETVFGLSDEQYVRNVVSSLFGRQKETTVQRGKR